MWRLCPCGYDFGAEVLPPPFPGSNESEDREGVRDRYRTFWRRFFAGVVDGLVLLPLAWLDRFFTWDRSAAVLILWTVFVYGVYAVYSVWMHARYGQTVGKMVTRVKVLQLSEEATPSLRQSALRDIGNIVASLLIVIWETYVVILTKADPNAVVSVWPMFVLNCAINVWFLLEFLTMILDSKRRALHDHIAGTVVVLAGATSSVSSSRF